MGVIPSSVVAAVAASTAAGKNPWLPFGMLLLLAAPGSVPSWLMEGSLHDALHALGPPALLYTLGGIFVGMAIADSIADKIPFVERWLVPISTAWRPFAGVAVATLIAIAAAHHEAASGAAQAVAALEPQVVTAGWGSGALVGVSVLVLSIGLGAVYGWLATIGKTGTRLLLGMIPLPSLRLAHSFIDDLFAIGVLVAGFAHGHSVLVVGAAALYLALGLVTGPLLARLTWIHVRIGWSLVRKAWRKLRKAPPAPPVTPPAWLERELAGRDVDGSKVTVLSGYVYRAPEIGLCRSGFVVFAPDAVWFASRSLGRTRLLAIPGERLARVGLAQSVTARIVSLVERTAAGGLREAVVYLFPAEEAEVLPVLESGARDASLARVRVDSESARRALPGYAQRGASVRYLAASEAGSLRLQALVTLGTAIAIGIMTAGAFIPIGAGYVLSPHKRRFLLGLVASCYLSLCVVGSFGMGWPAAVVYATLLNAVALRDLARLALKARIDGFVDRRAFMPPVCDRAWVRERDVVSPGDRWREADGVPVTDGSWRAVVALLAQSRGSVLTAS